MQRSIRYYKLVYNKSIVGARVVICGDPYDISLDMFNKLSSALIERKTNVVLVACGNVEMSVKGNLLVSSDESNVSEISTFDDLAYILSYASISVYQYEVTDVGTGETVIRSNDKVEVKKAIKTWQENNVDCLLAIYKDGECIYP